MFENFIKTYPKPKDGPAFRFTTMVRHNGTVIAFAMDEQRRIFYSVLDLGDQRTKGPIDVNYWQDNPQEVRFPNEVHTVGEGLVDPKMMPVYKLGSPGPVTDDARVKESEKDVFRSTTASLSALAPIQVLSDNKYIYIFRQSIANEAVEVVADTMLVDRFVLSGATLNAKREVRYQRSRNKFRPESRKDSLGAKDMEQKPFFEPTQKLEFIRNLHTGRFAVLVVPTQIAGILRWQLFAYNNKTGMVDSFNIERSADGLFNLQGSNLFVRPDSETVPILNGSANGSNRIFAKESFAEWALQFDGSGGAVALDKPIADVEASGYAFEFWLQPQAIDSLQTLMSAGGQEVGSIIIDAQGQLLFAYAPSADGQDVLQFGSAASLAAGEWTHVALVLDAENQTLSWIVNGERTATLPGVAPPSFTNVNAQIGAGAAGNYAGLIDEIRIWTRPRSAEEIAADMQHRLIGFELGLALYWRLDEGSGATVTDQSEDANTGAISGNVTWATSDAPIGDHPGVRRSSFRFHGRDVVTGMSALLYYHQENNKSGYDGKDKPLKTKARVMLATATHPHTGGEAGKNHIAILDFGLSRDGKLGQIPDNIRLQNVAAPDRPRTSREIQQQIAFWEQRQAELQKLIEELEGNIDLPEGQGFLDAAFRRLPADETDSEIVLARQRAAIRWQAESLAYNESEDPETPTVLAMASWQYDAGVVAEFVKTTAGASVTAVEEPPKEEDDDDSGDEEQKAKRSKNRQDKEEEEEQPEIPPEQLVGTPEWLALWTGWQNDSGSGEAAVKSGSAFYYFKGDSYLVFDWTTREFAEPVKIADGVFPDLWAEGVDAALATEDRSIVFFKGLFYKQFKPTEESGFELEAEGNINARYPAVPFVFLHPEYRDKTAAEIDAELTQEFGTANQAVQNLQAELEQARRRELENLEIEVEMFLVHADPAGLTTLGGLLTFAWAKDAPLLFDSANGKLALYFQGADDQFFVVYYDSMTSAANFELPAGNATKLICMPRMVGPMAETEIKITGEDQSMCDVSFINPPLSIDEAWHNVPRAAARFAKIINGAAAPVAVGELAADISGEINFVELENTDQEALQRGAALVFGAQQSAIKFLTQQVALSFEEQNTFAALPDPVIADAGSIELWIAFDGRSNQTIFDASAQPTESAGGKFFTIDIRNRKLRFNVQNQADESFDAKAEFSSLNVGKEWRHLVAVWQFGAQGFLKLYLDGNLIGDDSHVKGARPDFLNPFLGKPRGDYFAKGNFRGQIAEISVHGGALTQEQIQAHHQLGIFGIAPESLRACWRFQTANDVVVAADYSDNKVNGTVHGEATLAPVSSGALRVDIQPLVLTEAIQTGTPVYTIVDYSVNGKAAASQVGRASLLFAVDASKATGNVQNITVLGSSANSPLPRWVAYAQGSTLEFDGNKGEVVPKDPASLPNFDAKGDVSLEAWVRPEPVVNGAFSRVVHHYSGDSLYVLGFEPKPLQSAMYFNATDAEKAYAWAAQQVWNVFLGAQNWAFAAADAAIATTGTQKQIAEAAENAARDAISPILPFYYFFFWGHYERDRVGELAYNWAFAWAATHTDYIECANAPQLNPNSDQWTVELWFKADRLQGPNILYNKEHLFEAMVEDGVFKYAWQPHWTWESAFPVARGQWYHVAIVYDGQKQRIYKDGQLVLERAQSGKLGSTAFPLLIGARYIGSQSNPPTHFFRGAIDELRVWGEARTQQQILNNINKRLRGDEENLRGYWHFDEGLARDFSRFANDGLIKDSPHTVESIMPGLAITAGVGNRIEGGFSDIYVQSKKAIPYFYWNHIAATYNASYGLRFTDEDALIDAGNSSTLDLSGDLTIEIFFRLDDLRQPRGLVRKGNALPAYSVYIDLQGRPVFTFVDEKGKEQVFLVTTANTIRTGRSYRLAVVRRHQSRTRDVEQRRRVNGETVTINVPEVEEWDDIEIHVCEWMGDRYDRRLALSQKYGGDKPGQNSENLTIGRASGRTSTTFKGVIGEVRIWSRGLAFQETCQELTGAESGLVSWWRFDENDGYVAEDATGSNHANITLADWVQNPDPEASSFQILSNGVPMETVAVAPPAGIKSKNGFWVGPVSNKPRHDAFRGTAEELRVWRVARTQEQIQDNMFLRLIGEKEDLIAYYTFDQSEENELKDLSLRGNHLFVTDATFVVSDAPIGHDTFQIRNVLLAVRTDFHDTLQGQPGVQEYGDLQFDSEKNLIGILKRTYSFIKNGQWYLVTGFKVGNLVTEWIGQVQFNPELKGYIEGAPPVPSENLTAGPVNPAVSDYTGVSSVEVVEAESVTYTYATSKEAGLNASFGLSAKFGVDTTVLLITAPLGIGTATEVSDVNVLVGLEGKFDAAAGWSSENTVGIGRNLTKSTKITLGGNWEDPTRPLNSAMRRRYQPANVGFALVQSETADVFALRLEHNLALVSFQFRPNPDIPKDWNIIPFPINPRYTKQGTLDGAVGYDERGKVLDPDYPNAAEYGEHSYFKPKEAYSLKNRIVKDEQELINFFRSFDTNLGGAPDLAISAGLGLIDGATQGGAAGAISGLVDALANSTGLPEKIGKQNLVNTYVWTADGGFFAETTEVTSMRQETTGGSFSFSGEVGAAIGVDFSVAGVDVSLGFSAMLGGSLNLTKTKNRESQNSFSLDVESNVPGDLQAYDENLNRLYDAQGNPLIVPGKVDAFRFMSFYLEASNENFDAFFNRVVDPIWLAGNHPNALALQQAQQNDKKPPCWRVMHRVTFVSRILPEIPAASAPPLEKNMRVANVESNWQLIQKLEPFVRNKTGNFVEFSDAIRNAVNTYLPALKPNVEEIIRFMSAYYQVFEDV